MTDYKEEADEIVKMFFKILSINYNDTDTKTLLAHKFFDDDSLKIAILSQQRVVDELEYLKVKSTACNASDIFAGRLEYHQNLLKELMERL